MIEGRLWVDRRHRRHLASGPATKVPLEPAGIRALAGQLGDLSRAAPFPAKLLFQIA